MKVKSEFYREFVKQCYNETDKQRLFVSVCNRLIQCHVDFLCQWIYTVNDRKGFHLTKNHLQFLRTSQDVHTTPQYILAMIDWQNRYNYIICVYIPRTKTFYSTFSVFCLFTDVYDLIGIVYSRVL